MWRVAACLSLLAPGSGQQERDARPTPTRPSAPLDLGGSRVTVSLKPGGIRRAPGSAGRDATHRVAMRDSQGRAFTCELPPQPRPGPDAPEAGAAAAAPAPSSATTPPPPPTTTQGEGLGDAGAALPTWESILEPLRTTCVKKKTGWWTYEVCHGDEVRQYHGEQKRIDSSQSWSLGIIGGEGDPHKRAFSRWAALLTPGGVTRDAAPTRGRAGRLGGGSLWRRAAL